MTKHKSYGFDGSVKIKREGEQMRVVLTPRGGGESLRLGARLDNPTGQGLLAHYMQAQLDEADLPSLGGLVHVVSATEVRMRHSAWKGALVIEDGVLNVLFESPNDPSRANNLRWATSVLGKAIQVLGWTRRERSVGYELEIPLALELSDLTVNAGGDSWVMDQRTGSSPHLYYRPDLDSLVLKNADYQSVLWAAEVQESLEPNDHVGLGLMVVADDLSAAKVEQLRVELPQVYFLSRNANLLSMARGELEMTATVVSRNTEGELVLGGNKESAPGSARSSDALADLQQIAACFSAIYNEPYVVGEDAPDALSVLKATDGQSPEQVLAALRSAGLLRD